MITFGNIYIITKDLDGNTIEITGNYNESGEV